MNKLCLAVVVILLLTLPVFAKTPLRTIEGTVTKISDADTIHVTDSLGTKVRVRFYGIDQGSRASATCMMLSAPVAVRVRLSP